MKKLFANVTYSFNNFYSNLNTEGQMVFSLIMGLLILLCIILFIAYIIESMRTKKSIRRLNRKIEEEIREENVEEDKIVVNEEKEETKIEDIKNAIEKSLNEEVVSLTNFEEDQERTAIISIDELMKKAKELEVVDDEVSNVNYLEKYNIDPSEVEEKKEDIEIKKEVKAFKVSQVISPIYGVKKDVLNDKEA